MLATLTDRAPTGGWIYEPKLDGVRVLAYVTGGSVRLFSRNRKQVEGGYPELVEALSLAVRGDAVLDGEIVAPDPATGLSSFARLQQRMHLRDVQRAARTGVSVELYLFDCLFYEGIDLAGLPLLDRKKVLRDVVWYDGPIHFTPYRTTGSAAMYREACAKGAEGIIAKRAESRYVSGRSADWLKIKCVQQQEFVIGGYTGPQGAREHLGALLVGYYDGGSAALRGQGGHRLRPPHAGAALQEAGPPAPPHLAVRARAGPGRRGAVGHAEARGSDRVRGMDRSGAAAAPAVPRAPGRQGGAGGAAGGLRPAGRASPHLAPPPAHCIALAVQNPALTPALDLPTPSSHAC